MAHKRRVNAIVSHLVKGKEDPSIHHFHGKGRVRIVKVYRKKYPELHEVKQFTVQTILEGPVDEAFTKGDNSKIIATDTQKNTIYVLGKRHDFRSAEEFAMIISRHFVTTYPDIVYSCKVTITEDHWERLRVPDTEGKITDHHHAFKKIGPHNGWACAEAKRDTNNAVTMSLSSGVRTLTLLKTTQSSFANFVRDQYTLLPEVKDRLMSSAVDVTWDYDIKFVNSSQNWEALTKKILERLVGSFCGPANTGVSSASLQQTAYDMGCEALKSVKGIDRITLFLPNIHNIPVNLTPLGLENKDHTGNPNVFVATSEPYGIIQITVDRDELKNQPTKSSPVAPVVHLKSGKSQITTHVLDTSTGAPAKGIRITLQKPNGIGWENISSGITNADGRISNLLAGDEFLSPGIYRMHFETGPYYQALGEKTFYPEASVVFETFDTEHYHIPLLLNPFGYSTYRGS